MLSDFPVNCDERVELVFIKIMATQLRIQRTGSGTPQIMDTSFRRIIQNVGTAVVAWSCRWKSCLNYNARTFPLFFIFVSLPFRRIFPPSRCRYFRTFVSVSVCDSGLKSHLTLLVHAAGYRRNSPPQAREALSGWSGRNVYSIGQSSVRAGEPWSRRWLYAIAAKHGTHSRRYLRDRCAVYIAATRPQNSHADYAATVRLALRCGCVTTDNGVRSDAKKNYATQSATFFPLRQQRVGALVTGRVGRALTTDSYNSSHNCLIRTIAE